jgi:hypothetical protein
MRSARQAGAQSPQPLTPVKHKSAINHTWASLERITSAIPEKGLFCTFRSLDTVGNRREPKYCLDSHSA